MISSFSSYPRVIIVCAADWDAMDGVYNILCAVWSFRCNNSVRKYPFLEQVLNLLHTVAGDLLMDDMVSWNSFLLKQNYFIHITTQTFLTEDTEICILN